MAGLTLLLVIFSTLLTVLLSALLFEAIYHPKGNAETPTDKMVMKSHLLKEMINGSRCCCLLENAKPRGEISGGRKYSRRHLYFLYYN